MGDNHRTDNGGELQPRTTEELIGQRVALSSELGEVLRQAATLRSRTADLVRQIGATNILLRDRGVDPHYIASLIFPVEESIES